MTTQQVSKDPHRPLKLMTILNLVLLSVQAWSGDVVNLFATFPSGAVKDIGAAFSALQSAGPGPLAIWHGIEGILILSLSALIAISSFWKTTLRSVRITSLLALFFVSAAALGGYLFVFSGFLDNGSSAQMGGSFIGAYAMTFLVLYYSK